VTDSRSGALGMSFEYDVEGRLSKAYQTNAPSQGAVYAYDAQDRLASRTATSGSTTTTTLYVHDLNDHIIAETNASGQTLREYIWLNDLPVAIVDKADTASPVIYYVHTDHLGRPARLVLAQYWHWAWDVAYGPFGEVAGVWADPGVTQDMRFPGQWFQMESGLAYNWHRHYDATLGRYVQPDPLRVDSRETTLGGVPINAFARNTSAFDVLLRGRAHSALSGVMRLATAKAIEDVTTPQRNVLADGPAIYGYVGQSPLTKTDPEGLYGTGSCAFYAESCRRFGGYYECYVAPLACPTFQHLPSPLENWGDCVRQCLQEKSKRRRPNCSENIGDHGACFAGCYVNEENPYKYNGPALPDDDVKLD